MLVLTRGDVEALLDLDELLDALTEAHIALSDGLVSMPPRIGASVAERGGLLAAMPAHVPGLGLACKLVSVFPGNVGLPSHQAVVAVFDDETGEPVALLDGEHITATRTAAAAALAMRVLARDDARVLAILGTGVQARSHHRVLTHVREWDEVRVAGRAPERVTAFAGETGARPAASWEEAVRGADVVAATTHADRPVVLREWLAPGTHVSSVGFNVDGREVDEATVADAKVVVESRASALAPPPAGAPDLVGADVHAELGEILAGRRPGRESDDELTLYRSVGVAVQDVAAAAVVLRAARERGAGTEVAL